ncbi:MAG: outer membrane lipoprotein-sorting protein [Candidatus Aminicenantes bacterium]|nr:outer membrane lipoprotein-sorting protein [Candidatus Aminicenantes bacterium]
MKRVSISTLAVVLMLWAAGGPALAGEDAAVILAGVDARTGGNLAPKDIQSDMVMTIVQGNLVKEREIRAWTRNNPGRDDDRLMKFISPADVRDVGFLVLSDDTMYIYLPEFKRTRRIASSNKKDSFMSSDFSYDDLGTGDFTASYDPVLKEESPLAWVLELKKKAGADQSYARIVMTVDKEMGVPVKTEMYDDAGRLWKSTEQAYASIDKYRVMSKVKMTDHRKNSTTTLEFKNIKVDKGVGDDLFTERNLVRSIRG